VARREDLKAIRSGFDVMQHRILTDVTSALRAELSERAHMELPEPTNKSQQRDKLSLRVAFQGEVSERDQRAARDVLQGVKNPAQLLFLLRKHQGAK
jgi:hypothetical protein